MKVKYKGFTIDVCKANDFQGQHMAWFSVVRDVDSVKVSGGLMEMGNSLNTVVKALKVWLDEFLLNSGIIKKKGAKMEEYVHFRINFDWFTDHIRNLWAEGSYRKALEILSDCNLDKESSYKVIRGNLKLAQDPEGKEGIDGIIQEDNWQPNLALCHQGKYPDPEDLFKIEDRTKQLADLYISQSTIELNALLKELMDTTNGEKLEEIEERINSFPDEVFERCNLDKGKYYQYLQKARDLCEKSSKVEKYVEHQIELEDKPLPAIDTEMKNLYGWLSPKGEYYPCDYLDHIWLAGKLGMGEEDAETQGWIKITASGIWHVAQDKASNAQVEKVLAYCTKHGYKVLWNSFLENQTAKE